MLEQKETKKFVSVLGSTGDFRMTVDEGTPGATKRQYETSDGKKGEKWELAFSKIGGKIVDVEFFDGNFGKNLIITFDFENGEEPVAVSLGTNTPYAEDVMKKIPNLDLNEWVVMSPYSFTADNGKPMKGMTIMQGDTKVQNFFVEVKEDKNGKRTYKNLHGLPEPTGDESDSNDWKLYFLQVNKFLVKYTEDNIVPQFANTESVSTPGEDSEEF